MKISLAFPGDCQLGEGACWDDDQQQLWWVDILGKKLFRGDPATGRFQSWDMPTEIGACLPAKGGKRLVMLRDRVESFSDNPDSRSLVWKADEPSNNRFNDAGIDPKGNLWITTMDFDAAEPTGQLWRLDGQGDGRSLAKGYKVLNGPVFSPDGAVIYFADTMNGQVLKATHDVATGTLTDVSVFVDLGPFGGLADGMAIDADGCLWLARITAGRVSRYSPSGEELQTIAVPVPMVTSVTFGGPDLKTLFITTARILLSDPELAAYPLSGSVFAVDPGVCGLPSAVYEG